MPLPLDQTTPPMEAESVAEIPLGPKWQYEPKWDGFRCLAFRDGDEIELRSKSGQPLGRYFPDLVAALREVDAKRFILDGEIVIPIDGIPSFEELQLRLHPAASRVQKLAAAHPAMLELFDILADPRGHDLTGRTLRERRAALEAVMPELAHPALTLSPRTGDPKRAQAWLDERGTGRDGVMAKRLDMPYRSGHRDAMVKIKRIRSADCVVGGYRHLKDQTVVGSLLLGLYDADGKLDHVGFTATIKREERSALTQKLEALAGPSAFTGRAPGGPSRWSNGKTTAWHPIRPELVVEVEYDHVSGGRFRHGTSLLRFRPDKAPSQCLLTQILPPPGAHPVKAA
jgi:ATP-dependent DNA ligase